jgi:antitoxin HicB
MTCIIFNSFDVVRMYRIVLRNEPEGGYTVTVPSLPGCITYGENVEEAISMAKEAIELHLEELHFEGEEIPEDSKTLVYSILIKSE